MILKELVAVIPAGVGLVPEHLLPSPLSHKILYLGFQFQRICKIITIAALII